MGPEELQEQKDNLEKIRASLLKSKELGRKAEEAYKASDKAIESINETLLKIQVDTINWNNNIGMAWAAMLQAAKMMQEILNY